MADSYNYYSNVNSFPTTKMESVNKLITENSLTRLINRLLDIDGFIITDGLSEADTGSIGNGGEHLKINSNLDANSIAFKNDLFEFVIRGYYFSIDFSTIKNEMDSYINHHQPISNSIGLYARIFIDNTNPNYPELVGQTAYEDDPESFIEGQHYGVQFFICNMGDKPVPFHPTLPIDQNTQEIQNLGTNYLYFDLLLLEYIYGDSEVKEGLYIPFESLSKFDSHSINIIDGGVLELNS